MLCLSPRLVAGLCLAGSLLVSGSAPAQQAPPSPGAQAATATAQPDPLRAGDVIRLRIWQEPELSGEFPVGQNGSAVLPKLGPVAVAGQPPEAVRTRLVRAYQQFLQHSSIDVVLLRRVQILGAVRNPGLYNVDPTMTVSDALALAGGPTQEGARRRVELVRDGRKVDVRLTASTPLAGSAVRSGDQLVVPERSWLSRNTGVVTAGVTGGISLLIALLR